MVLILFFKSQKDKNISIYLIVIHCLVSCASVCVSASQIAACCSMMAQMWMSVPSAFSDCMSRTSSVTSLSSSNCLLYIDNRYKE